MSYEQGSCHCGAIKLRILGGFEKDDTALVCHCEVCTTLAGSLFAYTAKIVRKKLQVVEGTPKGYKPSTTTNTSGKQVTRYFCSDCGTPLWGDSDAVPESSFVKLAPFGNKPLPGKELFWKNAHEWEKPVVAPENLFDTTPR